VSPARSPTYLQGVRRARSRSDDLDEGVARRQAAFADGRIDLAWRSARLPVILAALSGAFIEECGIPRGG
jgi:hypothetical protein